MHVVAAVPDAPGFWLKRFPRNEGDGAPKSANPYGVRDPLQNRGRRLPARHMRSTSEAVAHAILRRPYGSGPRFNPALSVRDLTASSWRGLLVVPGGVPVPPECLVSRLARSAGAAPVPRLTTPRESAPKRTRWAECKAASPAGSKLGVASGPAKISPRPLPATWRLSPSRLDRPRRRKRSAPKGLCRLRPLRAQTGSLNRRFDAS